MNPFCCGSVEDTLDINDDKIEDAGDSSSDGLSDSAEKVVQDILDKISAPRGDLNPVLGTRKGVTFDVEVDFISETASSEPERGASADIQVAHPESPEEDRSSLPIDDQPKELKPEEEDHTDTEVEEQSGKPKEDGEAKDDDTVASEHEAERIVDTQIATPIWPQNNSETPKLRTVDDQSEVVKPEKILKEHPESHETGNPDNHVEEDVGND